MGKVKRVSDKMSKPTLKTNILKRKSLKHGTPIPKKLSARFVKQKLVPKSPETSPESIEESSDLESDIGMHKTEGQFIRASNNIDEDQIRKGVKALFEYILNASENKSELFDDEQSIFLQITAVKIPNAPNRHIRLLLKHSLLSEESDICLIVKDIGNPKDYDETIEHYQKHLIDHDITRIKTIIPYHQFKSEYGNQFELKRKLLGLYDYFLVDGRISGYVTHLLGKVFLEKRKTPTSIKMDASNLKDHVEKALRKTLMKAHSKGDSYLVQVGHSKMTEENVFENICEIIDELSDVFPGSLDNIRELGLKTAKGLTIPIYLTLKNQNKVNVTVVRAKRPKEFKGVTGELSTYLKKDVTVFPAGEIFTIDKSKETENGDEDGEFLDSDFLDDGGSDLFEDVEEDQFPTDLADDTKSDGDSETEEIAETNKKEKGNKKQIQSEENQNESEEDDLLEAEQMYLSEYEQKKVNTTKQKQEVKQMKDKSEGKETQTSSKVSHVSIREKKTKNQVNKDDPLNVLDQENEDIGKDVLRSNQTDNGNSNNNGQAQIDQQLIKGSKKKVKSEEEKGEDLPTKAIKSKRRSNKQINSKENKEIPPETVQNETRSNIAVKEKRVGRPRKKRDSPLKNEDTSENIPPKKSKKMPAEEISDIAVNQVPKKKQTKTATQANIKRKNATENDVNQGEKEKANVKQTGKGKKKGNVEKNEMEGNLLKNDNAQEAIVSDNIPKQKKKNAIVNDVNSKVINKGTRSTRNTKLEENTNTDNKRPTREPIKNIEIEVDDIATTSQQKTTQNKSKQRQKKQVEAVSVDAPVSTSVQKGKKTKASDTTNEISNKKTKKVPDIKIKKEKSETVSKKNEKNVSQKGPKNTKKDEGKTNEKAVEKKKGGKGQKVKKPALK